MKKLVLGMTLLTSISAFAGGSFVGDESWNKQAGSTFSTLEISGITMDSIDEALAQCRVENDLCVLKSSSIGQDNDDYTKDGEYRRIMSVKTVVQSIDDLYAAGMLERGAEAITDEDSWNSSGVFSALDHMGLRYESLADALTKCYGQGFQFCAIISSEITESNNYRNDGRRHSTGKSSVRGYSLKNGGFQKSSLGNKQLLPVPSVTIPKLNKNIYI